MTKQGAISTRTTSPVSRTNTEHAKQRLQRQCLHPRETNPFRVPLAFDPAAAELALPPPPPCFLLFFGADVLPAVEEDLRFLLPFSLLLPLELVVQPPALRSASARRVQSSRQPRSACPSFSRRQERERVREAMTHQASRARRASPHVPPFPAREPPPPCRLASRRPRSRDAPPPGP